jgi:pyridoxamine 5'-phosphate oxidase family protein
MFNSDELTYLKSQFLARLATATAKGKPNVVTVGFEFDGDYFYIGSGTQEILLSTPKYHNVKKGNKQVAMTIDDLVSVEPWNVRGIRVNGLADIVTRKGELGEGEYIHLMEVREKNEGKPQSEVIRTEAADSAQQGICPILLSLI